MNIVVFDSGENHIPPSSPKITIMFTIGNIVYTVNMNLEEWLL